MKQTLVAVFPDERSAFAGWNALKVPRDTAKIPVHASTVIVKEQDGSLKMRASSEREPLAILVGLVCGGLLGGLGGPIAAIAGAWLGMFAGLMCDVFRSEFDSDLIDEVAALLEPGNSSVIADLDEAETMRADARLASLGGRVLRRNGGEWVGEQVARPANQTAMTVARTV